MACPSGKLPLARRTLLRAGLCGVGALLVPRVAQATLFRGLSLPELAKLSELILLVTPLDASSHWEELGGRQRIVTDTRVRVEDVVAKAAPSNGELLVRTLGGTVGDRAALVNGEAALFVNQTSVLFLVRFAGALRVTAMAQGHYPLRSDADRVVRLTESLHAPELVGEGQPAMHLLPGLELDRARALIRKAL
ncbi:MAG: hypothetical protein ABI488_21575 [Polyangiaceae bacterium]